MKKIIVIWLLLLAVLTQSETIHASQYLTYQEIEFENRGNRLLRDYTAYDYDVLYRRLGGRRFWGWRTHTHIDNERVMFKKETLYIIRNEGKTPIRQNYVFNTSEQEVTQVSTTGSLGVDASGKKGNFEAGLDAQITASYSNARTVKMEETVEIHIDVDPLTELHVIIYGEGLISSGVGRQYRFFRNVNEGGWEIFTLTTEYYSIVKAAF